MLFALNLSREMGLTVAELLERMSSLEFTYRLAELDIEPRGEPAANRRAGLIAATIANWSGYAKTPHSIEQYMPSSGREAADIALDPALKQELKRARRRRKAKPRTSKKAKNANRRNNHR